MFTNTIDVADRLREIGYSLDPQQSKSILQHLFHTWVGSDEPESTDSHYRREVCQTVQALQSLIELTHSQEVGHG